MSKRAGRLQPGWVTLHFGQQANVPWRFHARHRGAPKARLGQRPPIRGVRCAHRKRSATMTAVEGSRGGELKVVRAPRRQPQRHRAAGARRERIRLSHPAKATPRRAALPLPACRVSRAHPPLHSRGSPLAVRPSQTPPCSAPSAFSSCRSDACGSSATYRARRSGLRSSRLSTARRSSTPHGAAAHVERRSRARSRMCSRRCRLRSCCHPGDRHRPNFPAPIDSRSAGVSSERVLDRSAPQGICRASCPAARSARHRVFPLLAAARCAPERPFVVGAQIENIVEQRAGPKLVPLAQQSSYAAVTVPHAAA